MTAIIRVGSKQMIVGEGDTIKVDTIAAEKGDMVELTDVLAVMNGEKSVFGKPVVEGAKVSAKVLSHGRGDKIRVFKFKPKKRYRLTKGHRQNYTELKIDKIVVQ